MLVLVGLGTWFTVERNAPDWVAITKLSKKELITYNKSAKIANTLNPFNPKQLDEII